MDDTRTMAQLFEAPTVGYEDAIVVPEITADNFELKHGLLTLVQNKQFFGHDKEDPHAHNRYFNKITYTMKFPNVPSSWTKRTKEDTMSRRSTKEDELRLCDIFVARGVEYCKSCKVEVWFECNLFVGSRLMLFWVHGDDVAKTVFRMRNGHVEVYSYAFCVNQCTSGFHRVNEPGRVRVAREDDCGVTEGREDVHEVFKQRGSRAKRKLSRCGRNRMGNEPILALSEEVDDFVMLYRGVGRRSEAKNEFEIDVRRSNLVYVAVVRYNSVVGKKEVEYQGPSGLMLPPDFTQ
ncbi:hypothetical protein Tco_0366211 [Tanacetum coccineum]